jgi:hypothetical protein
MKKHPSLEGLLIVVELAAEWPSLTVETPAKVRCVLAQDDAESPAAFALRVSERVTALDGRGVSRWSAIIACNERLDEPAQGARAELARAAASALARARGGNLLLSASDRNQGRSRAAFAALRAELATEWQSSAVEAKLRFGDDPVLLEGEDALARAGARRERAQDSPRSLA